MPYEGVVTEYGLFDRKRNNGQWPVTGAGNEVFLASKISRETFSAEDIPNTGHAFFGKLVIGDDNLVIEDISIRQGHPVQAKSKQRNNDSFFPMPAPETGCEIERGKE